MAIVNSNITIVSAPIDTSYYTSTPPTTSDTRTYFSALGSNIYELSGNGTNTTIFENDILRITGNATKGGSRPCMEYLIFTDKRNNTTVSTLFISNVRNCYMALGYDDSLQTGYYIITGQYYYDGSWNFRNATYYHGVFDGATQTQMYELISMSQAPTYQWSSVPTISGKNGVLSLPILIDTDGNPVSNGSASDFSTLPDSVKVRTLADLAVQ